MAAGFDISTMSLILVCFLVPDFYITPESKPSEPLLQPIFFSYLSKRFCYAILSP